MEMGRNEVTITRSVMGNERLFNKIGDTYVVDVIYLASVIQLRHNMCVHWKLRACGASLPILQVLTPFKGTESMAFVLVSTEGSSRYMSYSPYFGTKDFSG